MFITLYVIIIVHNIHINTFLFIYAICGNIAIISDLSTLVIIASSRKRAEANVILNLIALLT